MVKSKLHLRLSVVYLVLFLLVTVFSHAHPGGHYHKHDALNSWTLLSGKTIEGNFFMGRKDTIVLEQREGVLIKLPIKYLTPQFQALALAKIKKYQALNTYNTLAIAPIRSNSENRFNEKELWVIALFLLILSLFFIFKARVDAKLHLPQLFIFFTVLVSFEGKYILPKTNPFFIDSAFSAFKPQVKTSWDDHYFYVESNGLADHNMMVGITNWQQQVPLPQNYTGNNHWSIPLQPEYAVHPLSTKSNFMRGAIALAANGIPIFNALNNRGEDAYQIGELDEWGGHCGKGDDYHYHIAPMHLSQKNGLNPIAFALDGFPIYGSKEPDGRLMEPLDSCHGHLGKNGVYHYHGTMSYPYAIAYMRGKVLIDDSKPAPENQIAPQAFAAPVRPPTRPLRGASIVGLQPALSNGYSLTYRLNNKVGHINYSWDTDNNFFFTYIDTDSVMRNATYQRRR